MRLLVVEDDPDLNRQLCAALGDAGYAVDKAFDGEEGHYLGESEPYDAIVLDDEKAHGGPELDGESGRIVPEAGGEVSRGNFRRDGAFSH